jgi:hypothetical protein
MLTVLSLFWFLKVKRAGTQRIPGPVFLLLASATDTALTVIAAWLVFIKGV